MIYSSAPLRVTFAGGGSDYKTYYEEHGGAVFGAALDQRVHVFINPLSKFADENIRFTYRNTESVQLVDDIRHPVVREALRYFGISERINIATMADLPGKSGLGSSSAFTVALIGALARYIEKEISLKEIVDIAYFIERDLLGEAGGIQDHLHAAYGGLRLYELRKDEILVSDSFLNSELESFLREIFKLFRFGEDRNSTIAATRTVNSISRDTGRVAIGKSAALARQYAKLLSQTRGEDLVSFFGDLLNKSRIEKEIFQGGYSEDLNSIVSTFMKSKVSGIKICGAGDSGFLLMVGNPGLIDSLASIQRNENFLSVKLSNSGLTVHEL